MAEPVKALTKMKEDVALDYAEFQLSQCRTRCRLYISVEGVIKKLATGFLKPFLTHLRTVEEQVGNGKLSIRLECNPSSVKQNGRPWFTKGTVERFVRFVSTPEVLVQVRTIEDEITQLHLLQKSQSKSIQQARIQSLSGNGAISRTDRRSVTTHTQQNGSSIQSRRYQLDVGDDAVVASKKDLLKAMDVHLLVLKQEQEMAFSRTAAAGFDTENIDDLIIFAENFGANRLREACMDFINLLRKRDEVYLESKESSSLTNEILSSCSDISPASGTDIELIDESENSLGDGGNTYNLSYAVHMRKLATDKPMRMNSQDTEFATHDKHWGGINVHIPQSTISQATTGMHVMSAGRTLSKEQAAKEGNEEEKNWKKRHGFFSGSKTSSDIGYGKGQLGLKNTPQDNRSPSKDTSFFTQLQRMIQKIEARGAKYMSERSPSISTITEMKKDGCNHSIDRTYSWHELDGSSGSSGLSPKLTSEDFPTFSSDDYGKLCVDVNKSVGEASSSSKKRCSSQANIASLGTKQVGSVALHSNNIFSQGKSNDDIGDKKAPKHIRNNKEDRGKISDLRHGGTQAVSFNKSVRSLSVQDAINLFESRKDTSKGCERKLIRQGSFGAGNSSLSKRAAPRRWSGVHELCSDLSTQEKLSVSSDNQTVATDIKPNSHKYPSEESRILRDIKGDSGIESTEGQHHPSSVYQEGLQESSSGSPPFSDKIIQPQLQLNLKSEQCNPLESDKQLISKQSHDMKRDTHPSPENSDSKLCVKQNQSFEAGLSSKTCDKQPPMEHKHTMGRDSPEMIETDKRKQFKLELERSLARVLKHNNPAVAISLSKHVDGNSKAKETSLKGNAKSFSKENQAKLSVSLSPESGNACQMENCSDTIKQSVQDNSTSTVMIEECSEISLQTKTQCSASVEMLKKPSLLAQEQLKPEDKMSQIELNPSNPEVHSKFKMETKDCLNSSMSHPSNAILKIKNNGDNKNLSSSSVCDATIAAIKSQNSFKGENMGNLCTINDYNTAGNTKNESKGDKKDNSIEVENKPLTETLGTSWTNSSIEFYMEALLSIASHQYYNLGNLENGGSAVTHRGKLYGYYNQLRNARLQQAQSSKRKEREVKIKDIGEILYRRKTEMEARTARLARRSNSLTTMHSQTVKSAEFPVTRKKQEIDAEEETCLEECLMQAHDQSNSSPSSSASMPYSIKNSSISLPYSEKEDALVSQECSIMMYDLTCGTGSQSPRSVLKYPTGKSSDQQKAASFSNQESTTKNPLSQSDSDTDSRKKSSVRCTSGSQVLSKNMTTINGSKDILVEGHINEGLKFHGIQNKGTSETLMNKLSEGAVAPIQEARPVLRGGDDIGTGANIMELKTNVVADDPNKSYEGETSSPSFDAEDCSKENACVGSTCSEKNVRSESCTLINIKNSQLSPRLHEKPKLSEVLTLSDDFLESDIPRQICDTVPSLIAYVEHKKENDIPVVPSMQLHTQSTTESEQIKNFTTSSVSNKLLHCEPLLTSFSPAAASPSCSSVEQSFITSRNFSHPPLNYGQIKHVSGSNVVRTRKTWVKPQNPIIIAIQRPTREAAKGLKKFLKIGRKGHACETTMTDGASASTASDCDDDLDDSRDMCNISSDVILRKARVHERIYEHGNIIAPADSYTVQD